MVRSHRRSFKEGEAVEARVNGSGFHGAWYEARVVRHRPERGRCTVVHDSLLDDDSDEPRPLKEVLYDVDVRPRPPPPPSDGGGFEPHQRVDALYNDGWWDGVVERVLGDEGEGSDRKYAVRFPETAEELEFSASELRPHLDWVNRKWVVPRTQEDKPIKSQKFGGGKMSHKSIVPHGFNRSHAGDDDSVHNLDIYDTGSDMITEGSTSQSQLVSSRPCKKRKRKTIEDNTRLIDCLPKSIRRSSRVRRGQNISMLTAEKRPKFHLKTFLNDKFHCSMTPFEENSVGSPTVSIKTSQNTLPEHSHDEQPFTPARLSEELLLPHTPLSRIEPADKGEELSRPGDAGSENQFKSSNFYSSISNQGLPMGNDQKNKALATRDEPQQSKSPPDNGIRKYAAGNKRRKNIPRKVRIIDTKASSEAMQLEQSDCKNDGNKEINQDYGISVIVDSNSVSQEVQSSCTSQAEAATQGKQLEQSDCKSDGNKEKNPDLGISVIVDTSSISGKVQLYSTSQAVTATQGDTCLKDSRRISCISDTGHMSHEVQLHSASQVEIATRGDRCLTDYEDKMLSDTMVPAQVWPFEKQSPMWEFVESMEVISKMLQLPHFRPLEQYSEVFREGRAIGLMVTYNNLMNTIGDLKIDDPDHKFMDKKLVLVELEEHGFDVRSLRTRLDELLRIRGKHVQLSENSSALKLLIIEKNKEEERINSEMEVIDKAIVDLKETLSHLCRRKRSILEQKEEHDAEMGNLQLNANIVKEDFQSVERDFERIRAAAW